MMRWAWDSPDYSKGDYAEAQARAKEQKKGLWGGLQPIAPWDWRYTH